MRCIWAVLGAFGLWLLVLHRCFEPPAISPTGISSFSRQLAARHLSLWTDASRRQRELDKMRGTNAEWDFMGRSFLVWSLVNMGLREPERKADYLAVIDTIIDETLVLERERGMLHFLMPYARARPFVMRPPRSQFLDGEIALMLGLRRLLDDEKPAYRAALTERIDRMVDRMQQSPTLSAESYPNECWTFCNTVALAAVRVADRVDGSDHSAFIRRWIETARRKLVEPDTGLLVSSYTLDGSVLDGPEGSSIWLSAHMLDLVDSDFARDQYRRARHELGRTLLGFGYAREWPSSQRGHLDVDSGLVVPGFDVSAGSSGLAFVGASAFGDRDFYDRLTRTIFAAGFPVRSGNELSFAASNQVGDAVLLYSTVLGPAWQSVREGRAAP